MGPLTAAIVFQFYKVRLELIGLTGDADVVYEFQFYKVRLEGVASTALSGAIGNFNSIK